VTGASRSDHAGDAFVAIGLLLLAGVVLGVGWVLVAPTVEGVVVDGGIALSEQESARIFDTEGVFAVIVAAAGVATAILASRWLRRTGALAVVTLSVGGLLASVVAWRVGVWFGADPVEVTAAGLPVGSTAALPLRLGTTSMLLLWPIATVFVTLWMAVLGRDATSEASPDSLRPDRVTTAAATAPDG
jgi:hypothetical protein